MFSFSKIQEEDKFVQYYTGFSKDTFEGIFKFLVPNELQCPLSYIGNGGEKAGGLLSLKDQLLLTLCKLGNNWDSST